jgi:hypothetical protein
LRRRLPALKRPPSLTASQTLAAVAFVAAGTFALPVWHIVSELTSDSYMTLYAGRWIAQHGLPHHEVFTLAAHGRRWVDQQWLAQLLAYGAWKLGGYRVLALLAATQIGGSFGLLAWWMRRQGTPVVLTIACASLAFIVTLPSAFIRAELFALPLFVSVLIICLADSQRQRPGPRVALVLPLLVLWANVHGSVLLGAGFVSVYSLYRAVGALGRADRRTAAALTVLALLAAATPLATPYGTGVVHYYSSLIGNKVIASGVSEWHSPVFGQLSFFIFAIPVALVLASLAAATAKGQRPPFVLLVAGVAAAVAAGLAARNTVWFGIVGGLLLAETARAWLPTEPPSRGFLTALTTAGAVILAAGLITLATRADEAFQTLTPVRAIGAAYRYAIQHPCAKILGDDQSSSALLWLYPQLSGRIAFDARLEQYPDPALERWFRFESGDRTNWAETIAGYQILIGSSSTSGPLVDELAQSSAARILAHDRRGIAVATGTCA